MTDIEPEPPVIQDLIYGLALSPTFADDGICFAARTSGLLRSDDGGQTWRSFYDTLELSASLTTSAVAVSPNFAHDSLVLAGVKGGILRTVDDGRNWRVMLFPPPAPLITTIVYSPNFAQDGIALVGTFEDGIFCSTDRGLHWAAWNFGLLDLSVYGIAFSPDIATDQAVFAGTESGIFRSANGGRSWRAVPFPTDVAPVVSLAVLDGGEILAGTEANGLFCSADSGHTWTRQAADTIPGVVNAILPRFPDRASITILLDDRILCSPDGGRTWELWARLDQSAVAIAGSASSGVLFAGAAEGRILQFSV
jgi:photosystem II stability/assembly factor-like uncharacterized protein